MNYKDFYKELLNEGEKTNSFGTLPNRHPYGFVVWPSGEFGVVEDWGGHMEVAGDGIAGMTRIIKSGGVRIAKVKYDGGEFAYSAEYLPTKTTQRAKKTSKDLADHYKIELEWQNASSWMKFNEGAANIIEDYPIGWNKTEFEAINSFGGKLKYAREHLQIIASGSGRSVFRIDDQKAIKIAKNKKGLAQNKVESDWSMNQYSVTAETFDIGEDVKGIGPFWIEMELAKKASRGRFKEITKVSIDDLDWYLREERAKYTKGRHYISSIPAAKQYELDNNEFVADLMSLANDFDMGTGDMGRLSTYGEVMREGSPSIVLVDFGLTNKVFNDFYKVG